MRSFVCHFTCAITLVIGSIAWSADPVQPAKGKLDLTFIPSDAVAAAVVHPQRVVNSPSLELLPTEIMTASGKKEWGFDPMEIEFALGVGGLPGAPGQGPAGHPPQPRFALLLRFTKPLDTKAVLTKLVKNGHDGQVAGKEASLSDFPLQPSVVLVDARTIAIGPEESLTWLLTADGSDSPLRKQMAAAGDAPDAAAFVSIEPLRPLLAPGMLMIATQLPPQFQDLTKLPSLIESLELRINNATLTQASVELDVAAKDAPGAAELQRILKQGLENGKAMLLAQVTADADRQPNDRELNEAMLHYMNRIGDKAVKALDPKQTGNHVVVTTELQGGTAGLGVMTALLLPATQAAREAANRNASQNNLKQIALCMLNYEDQHHVLPPRAYFDKEGKPLLSWRVMMLPDMEEGELFQQFHFDEPWDSEHNKTLIEKMPECYKDPRFELPPGMTIYQAVVGKGCVFEGDKGIKLAQLTDGTSKTAGVVAVSPKKAVPWTKPEDWEFDPKNPKRDLDNPSPGGIIQLMFMDGHIDGVPGEIDAEILKAVFTRNGGERVNLP